MGARTELALFFHLNFYFKDPNAAAYAARRGFVLTVFLFQIIVRLTKSHHSCIV
jgi:hypothetical protein